MRVKLNNAIEYLVSISYIFPLEYEYRLIVFAHSRPKSFSEHWFDVFVQWVVVHQLEVESTVTLLSSTLGKFEPEKCNMITVGVPIPKTFGIQMVKSRSNEK